MERSGLCVQKEARSSAEQLGAVGWGSCVFMVGEETCDHFEGGCS